MLRSVKAESVDGCSQSYSGSEVMKSLVVWDITQYSPVKKSTGVSG
jgi:hypothetical protein